jgi:hypothetical protein
MSSTPSSRLPLLVVLSAPLWLAACGSDTARTFGFTRDAPDEFQVTTRAPLSMPPSLGTLPTPRPGAQRPQEISVREQAEATLAPGALLGGRNARSGATSSGEQALLAATGRAAPGDIRQRIDDEAVRLNAPDRNLAERLMFWRNPGEPGTPVDPNREAQRLRENAALGREVTDGDTPVIQRPRNNSFLGGLRLF